MYCLDDGTLQKYAILPTFWIPLWSSNERISNPETPEIQSIQENLVQKGDSHAQTSLEKETRWIDHVTELIYRTNMVTFSIVLWPLLNVKIFFCFWRNILQWATTSSFTRFLDHTQRHITVGRTPPTSDQLVAKTSIWQHTTLTTDRHPCLRWDSNPQSQQASGGRSTPYTAQPLGLAMLRIGMSNIIR